MNNLQLWSAIVGFVLPPILSVVMQSSWKQQTQGVVAFIACAAASAGTFYFGGDLDSGQDVGTTFLLVFTAAIGSYRLYWKPSGIAPAIEAKTNR